MSDKNILTDAEKTKINDILKEQLHIRQSEITPEANLIVDLGADSLDLVEITMKAEDEFGMVLPDDDAEKVKTVGDFYRVVGELLGKSK